MSDFCVAKFGGTSVANSDAMLNCMRIVTANPKTKLVVLSASAGVTNLLVKLANGVADEAEREETISKICAIQNQILDYLGHPEAISGEIKNHIDQIRILAREAVYETNDVLVDRIVCNGELMSTKLFTEVMKKNGYDAVWFDVRKVMRTDNNFGKAAPIIEVLRIQAQKELSDLVQNHIVITQGFIGSNAEGQTTTLGRGGSDYSAALLGEALNFGEVEIWTDVPGIYTTDPRIVSTAHAIPEISFAEAAEMATFGAKILHPATVQPAMRANIPVFVGSSKEPRAGGTWIRPDTDSKPLFRAVAIRKNQILLTLKTARMVGACGFLSTAFGIFAKHGLSVDLVTTSEQSIAVTLDNTGTKSNGQSILSEALLADLRQIASVKIEEDLSLIALISNHMSRTPGSESKVFSAIFAIPIRLICYGASSHNTCFLVHSKDGEEAVRRLHVHLLD